MDEQAWGQGVEQLEIRASLLGPAEISVGGQPLAVMEWPRRAPRSLLFMLLGSPGYRVPRDLVIDTLWPDLEPEAAANQLYKAIHALRKLVEPAPNGRRGGSVVALTSEFVGLREVADIWVDANAFERGVMTRSLDSEARRGALRQALQLYRGDFLADEPYLDWPVARRESLRSLHERAVLELAALDRDAGDPLASVPLLEALLGRDPVLEAAYQELMRSHLAAGDREAASRVFQRCAAILKSELGEAPDAQTCAILDAPEPLATEPARRRLPVAPTALVGREQELDRIEELFADPEIRLVTLTGPGGVGKTRLAIEAAWQLASRFEDGAVFVPLSSVRDGEQLGFAVANALGVRPGEAAPTGGAIGAATDGQRLLLVLDNVEQVVDTAARFVSDWLAASRGPNLIVTSRERLHIRGERDVAVPPLAVPDAGSPAGAIAGSEAVELFVRLVRAHDPDFSLTADNAPIIARICARLDGLPLSLELAASRMRRMRPEVLLEALEQPLRALTAGSRDLPERHRTLRDAIGWSYDLLPPDEQRVFRALAVFAGGATEAALDALAPGGSALFDSLADKSLAVWTDTVAGPRVSLLETIREYAEGAARDAGEWETLRAGHAAWIAGLVGQAEEAFLGRDQRRWTERLDHEMGNLRRAVAFAWERQDGPLSASLIGPPMLYLEHRGHAREGFAWAHRALALGGMAERDRIRLLRAVCRLGVRAAEYEAAERAFEEARERAEQFGDLALLADVLSDATTSPWYRANADAARPIIERAHELHCRLGNRHGEVLTLIGLAMLAMLDGDVPKALDYDVRAKVIAREIGNPLLYLLTLRSHGITLAMDRQLEEAEPIFEEGLRLAEELHDPTIEAAFRHGLALAAAERGDIEAAIRGYQDVVEINRRIGHRQGYALGLLELGRVEWTRHRLEAAAGYLRRALDDFVEAGVERWAIVTYDYAAALLAETGDVDLAARLVGFADAARTSRHIARMELDAPYFRQLQADLERTLGAEALARLLRDGAMLDSREAHALTTAALDRVAGSRLLRGD